MLDFSQSVLDANTGIRRAAFSDAECRAAIGDQPGPRAGASSIDSEVEAHRT
jgi:hypothetical protein